MTAGWLFGREGYREQAETAQRQTTEAMEQTKEAYHEMITLIHEAMHMVTQPKTSQATFIHLATAANSTQNYTDIDHPSTNTHPNALILVTPNWNPGGKADSYNDHPIGVWYHQGKWSIFNQDKAEMPLGAAFNVLVIEHP